MQTTGEQSVMAPAVGTIRKAGPARQRLFRRRLARCTGAAAAGRPALVAYMRVSASSHGSNSVEPAGTSTQRR